MFTYGVVYDSSQLRGLSMTLDFWKYKIKDLITQVDVNTTAEQCVLTGNPTFCNLMIRYPSGPNAGLFQELQEPIFNLGTLKTDGFDFGVKYAKRDTPVGSFNVSLDMTRINSYENVAAPGAAAVEVAGTFDRQFGNYAKWRGLLSRRLETGSLRWLADDTLHRQAWAEEPGWRAAHQSDARHPSASLRTI